ncbi:MAG: homocysteine S-methyltransferase family protein [Pseudomonadota bacterium]
MRRMFEEMVGRAAEESADLIVGETFYYAEEAYAALEIAKATELPAVIKVAPMSENQRMDGVDIVETRRFSEQMANHFMYGSNERLPEHIRALGQIA